MKIGIDIGHNVYGDGGAVGIRNENDLTMEVGLLLMRKLKELGHEVINCKPDQAGSVRQSLKLRCEIANRNNVDLFVSVHFNCANGKAHGSEVFAISSKGKEFAGSVLSEIVALGFFNRGVKDGNRFYVLKHTQAPAILVECAFCDSAQDMKIYNPESISTAILKGLLKNT